MDIVDWLVRHTLHLLTTAVTEAEIPYALAEARRRQELEAAIVPTFREGAGGRILPFDRDVSDVYATIATNRRKPADRSANWIAILCGASLATTRNMTDFDGVGLDVINSCKIR